MMMMRYKVDLSSSGWRGMVLSDYWDKNIQYNSALIIVTCSILWNENGNDYSMRFSNEISIRYNQNAFNAFILSITRSPALKTVKTVQPINFACILNSVIGCKIYRSFRFTLNLKKISAR